MSFATAARPSIGGRSLSQSRKRDSFAPTTPHGHAHAHGPAFSFSFPILTVEEILVCLTELNIHIDEDDLVKARPEAIRNVYEQLIYESLGMSKEELYTPKYAFMDAIKYEELHDESIPVLHFIRSMNKLLVASGAMDGFTLRDLVRPEPARVRRNLSAIINFQKYKEERLGVYGMHTSKTEELLRVQAELQARNDELQRQLREERALRAAEQPAIDALRADLTALGKQRDELDEAIGRNRAVTTEQKDTIMALRDAISSADAKMEGLRGEIAHKRSQIVASPARLRAEVENTARQLEEARTVLSAAQEEERTTKRRLEVVKKADKDVRKAITLLSELETELNKQKRVARDVKTRQGEVDTMETELASLKAQAEHLTRNIARAEARLSETQETTSAKEEAVARATDTARTELHILQEEVTRAKETKREVEVRKAELDAEKERMLSRHNAEMADMMAGIKHLQKLVSDYHARLFKAVSETAERPFAPPAAHSALGYAMHSASFMPASSTAGGL